MKKMLLWTLALLCLGAALAEVYGDDLYYHAIPDCMGHTYAPLEAIDGRWPCPVCVDEPDDNSLRCFSIGGLTVIRMTDGFMRSGTNLTEMLWNADEQYRGDEAEAEMGLLLHGAGYRRFKAALREGREAKAWGMVADSMPLLLSFRHLGSAWLEVIEPVDADSINPGYFAWNMTCKDGVLKVGRPFFKGSVRAPEIEDLSDREPVWEASGEAWRAALYEAEGLHILTLRLTGEDALAEPRVTLSCPGWPEVLTLEEPWRDGDTRVYGAALTEAETAMLKAGELSVRYRGFRELAVDYADTPYGMGHTESDRWFVLDDRGNIVLPPEYDFMERTGNVFLYGNWTESGNRDWQIYDADRRRTLLVAQNCILGSQSFAGGFYMPEYNPVKLYRDGEENPAAVLAGRRGFKETTALTLYGDPDIYLMRCHPAVARWFNGALNHPEVPEGVFVGCVAVDVAVADEDKRNCAVIVWRLDGGEKPSADALGLIDHENLGDYYFTQLKWMYLRLKQLLGANNPALKAWFPKMDEVVKQWIFR